MPIALIDEADNNPRNQWRGIPELAYSIEQYGVLQPLIVRARPNSSSRYQLLAGHRRLRALIFLKREHAPVIIRGEADDSVAFLVTLTDNLARENLRASEEAAALERLLRNGWSIRTIAEKIGRSHTHVAQRLRVFEDPVTAEPVRMGRIAVTTAQELLCVSNVVDRLLKQAIEEDWSKAIARQNARGWKAAFHRAPLLGLADRMAELTEVLRSQGKNATGQMSWSPHNMAAAMKLNRELTRSLRGNAEDAWDWRPLHTPPLPFDAAPETATAQSPPSEARES